MIDKNSVEYKINRLAIQKRYRDSHKDELKAKGREYYYKHRKLKPIYQFSHIGLYYSRMNKRRSDRLYYQENKAKIAEQTKLYMSTRKDIKSAYDKSYKIKNFDRIKKRDSSYHKTNNERVRMIVLQHYCNGVIQCACCGELIEDFLQIDHVGGRKIHNHPRGMTGLKLYNYLIKNMFPPGFQVLCANCNWGKYKNGICPHKIIVKTTLFPDISK